MRLTSKGQMTVPKGVREDLRLRPGSNVGLQKNDRGEFVLVNLDTRRHESPGESIARQLVEFGERIRREGKTNNLTTDEIMAMTRGPFDDVDPR